MAKRGVTRKDKKGRVLLKGESQRNSDGLYIYSYTDPFGKRRYVYSKSLAGLREKEKKLIKDQLDGLNVYASSTETLNKAFDRYMSTKYNLRETTKSYYYYIYDQYVRNTLGSRRLSEIKYSDIKFFYNYLLGRKELSISLVNSVHILLHPTFAMAVRDDRIRKNPTDGLLGEIKKESDKRVGVRHALTIEQQKAFIKHCEGHPDFNHWVPLFTVLLGTGCRVGEIIGLRWQDVDFNSRCISVNHSVRYYREQGHSCFGVFKPKTVAGIRTVPMVDAVYDVLKSEYARQKIHGFNTYEIEGFSGFIFVNRVGNLHNPNHINKAIVRIYTSHNNDEVLKAEQEQREPLIIPHFSCHNFRHTFCSLLCENDVNVKVIQQVMGHADIKTTLDIYTEISEVKKKEEITNLSNKLKCF